MWWTGRALRLHATVVVSVGLFLALGRWQLVRALSGNELSWAYTVEWPIFAAYAVFLWWKLLHEDVEGEGARRRVAHPERLDAESAELDAYNRYLASLQREDHEKRTAGR